MLEGGVDEAGIEEVGLGFSWQMAFPAVAGSLMNGEGAFEVGLFDAKVPVAEASGGDAGEVLEVFVGFVAEVAIVTCRGEDAVPEGINGGVSACSAGLEVGVACKVVFEGFPSACAICVEELSGFGSCS